MIESDWLCFGLANITQSSSQRENSTELTWDREALILSTELVLVWAKFISEPTDPVAPGSLPHAEEPGVGVGAGQRDVLTQRGEHLPLLRRVLNDLIRVVLVVGLAGSCVECEECEGDVRDHVVARCEITESSSKPRVRACPRVDWDREETGRRSELRSDAGTREPRPAQISIVPAIIETGNLFYKS